MKKQYNKWINEILKKGSWRYLLILLAGLTLGWFFFHPSSHNDKTEISTNEGSYKHKRTVWTCSMHPQIRMDKPGKCPICGMDLIPLKDSGSAEDSSATIDPNAIQLSEEALALANVQTSIVSRENPVKDLRLYGKIQADERLMQSQTANVNGRIERLWINYTGESVRKGQTIVSLYSPELYTAQQELLQTNRMGNSQQKTYLLDAAREKLRLWNFTNQQIAAIERSEKASPIMGIKATSSGKVIARQVSKGDYINQGAVLFQIADLSRVWAVFQAYEGDLPFLKQGNNVDFTLQAIPGKLFSGRISFIDPIINPSTHTGGVRVEINNRDGKFKPEMFVTGNVKASLGRNRSQLVIPQSAVLWTGKRSIVYVKTPGTSIPTFTMRKIELGPSLGNAYVVLSGLSSGEEIVTNGAFSIDASAQLDGKQSMMNQDEHQNKRTTSMSKMHM
jgi:Cu(I)/Ag(I) efflux system membrane fusion protein